MSWTPISECYVTVEFNGHKHLAGILSERNGQFHFAYGKKWLSNPNSFPFDPINLPLQHTQFSSKRLWGAFADSLPDNWGKRVMLTVHTQKPANTIEWLLATRGTGVGALTYSASKTRPPVLAPLPDYNDLRDILELLERIEVGDFPRDVDPNLIKLVEFGSSMGGARPKITVTRDGTPWLVKLSRIDDAYDQLKAEHACLRMASDLGIPTPEHHLETIGKRQVLLIHRFDYEGSSRRHYLSARSIISPDRVREGFDTPLSYLRIASDISRVSSAPADDRLDLFKRMLLNVLIYNSDDHLQNHGFLIDHKNPLRYRLSPCFDILPHPASTDLMALNIGHAGREATVTNALSAHSQFGLSHSDALQVLNEVNQVVNACSKYFADAGMSSVDQSIMSKACTRLSPEINALLSAS